jgi:hypothetical protein
MVMRLARSRRGSSTTGCLLWLLLFVAALYYGVHIGEVYYRSWQLAEEMKSQARLAPSLNDDVIQRRLVTRAEELGLPHEASNFRIVRTPRPRAIRIETRYSETVQLPFFNHTFTFTPRAEAPL